jgi:DNA invertase Pin-like site-specific DNA recombinase
VSIYENWPRERLVEELRRRDAAAYFGQGNNERGAGRKPKITPEVTATVRRMRDAGSTFREIAAETGLSLGTVYNAFNA